jgi:hypothetical protein
MLEHFSKAAGELLAAALPRPIRGTVADNMNDTCKMTQCYMLWDVRYFKDWPQFLEGFDNSDIAFHQC